MRIEDVLFSRLSSWPTLAALVGKNICPQTLPQGTKLPAVILTRISTARVQAHDGPSGLVNAWFQADVLAVSFPVVREIADAVRAALVNYRSTDGDVRIDGVMLLNEMDQFDEELSLYRVILEFEIWHTED